MSVNVAMAGSSLRDLDRLAELLDSRWRIPGTGIRVGVDALVGLIPGLGDVGTGVVSAVIIAHAANLGAPKLLLARMAGNVLLDTAVGSIPLLGSVFDVFFRANVRNVRLLRRHLERRDGAQPATSVHKA